MNRRVPDWYRLKKSISSCSHFVLTLKSRFDFYPRCEPPWYLFATLLSFSLTTIVTAEAAADMRENISVSDSELLISMLTQIGRATKNEVHFLLAFDLYFEKANKG